MSSSAPEPSPRQAEVLERIESADSDVAAARLGSTAAEPLLGIATYHCQQAAEKLLEAALILRRTPFPRTHDLDELARLVAKVWPAAGSLANQLRPLTLWGFAFRYPVRDLDVEPPRPEQVEAATTGIAQFRAQIAAELVAEGCIAPPST